MSIKYSKSYSIFVMTNSKHMIMILSVLICLFHILTKDTSGSLQECRFHVYTLMMLEQLKGSISGRYHSILFIHVEMTIISFLPKFILKNLKPCGRH